MSYLISTISLLCLSLSSVSAGSFYGWDTSSVNQTNINCLKNLNDAQFIVFTGHQASSNGAIKDVCNELSYAKSAGISRRDVKFSPCPNCGETAAQQFSSMMDILNKCSDVWSGQVWLDMINYSVWSTPWHDVGYKKNQDYFAEIVTACTSTKGVTCGVFSNSEDWKWILGSSSYVYPPANELPLWYEALTSGTASFDDFIPFGGFTTPYMKRFSKKYSNVCMDSLIYEDWQPQL